MNNSIYRRPFTPRCFANYKHTSPHHRTCKTASFKVSAGKIPHTAHCRERFTCQILHTREGLLLDTRHVQSAKQTIGSSFSSLEIIWMVFECLRLNNVTPSLPKLKPSYVLLCSNMFARSVWLFTFISSPVFLSVSFMRTHASPSFLATSSPATPHQCKHPKEKLKKMHDS